MTNQKPLFVFQVVLKESVTTPGQWEFVHPGASALGTPLPNRTSLLPKAAFPVTHRKNRKGVIVTCNDEIEGAFHRYDRSRFGEHFYVGSPYLTLGRTSAIAWRSFVARFGATKGKSSVHHLEIFPNYRFVFH